MKRPGFDGNFFFCFALNLVFSAYWAIPAVVLFVLHFAVGTPLWAAGVALAVWIVAVFAITAFLSWAVSTGTADSAESGRRGKTTVRYSSQQQYRPPKR